MSTPYLRTNQRTSRVVVAPRSRDATRPAKAVRPRLGSTYWGRTLRRSDTGGGRVENGNVARREFYRRLPPRTVGVCGVGRPHRPSGPRARVTPARALASRCQAVASPHAAPRPCPHRLRRLVARGRTRIDRRERLRRW